MDVDNNLDYNTNTDLSAMIVDSTESKSIHPFFEKPYPTSLLSSLDATSDSEKEQQQADLKRRREEDDDLDGNNIQNKRKPRNQTSSNLQNIGIGRSTKASHILNEKVANGSFVLNPKRWMNFRKKVILLDCDAILKDNEPKSVRHSKCGKCIQMKEPYNIAYFESHVAKCKNRTTSNTLTIENMFKNHPQPKQKKNDRKPATCIPCPGLSASDHSRIPLYLERTPATGGGTSKINKVSASLYPKVCYTDLSAEEQQNVLAAQRLERRWRNEHDLQRVYSMECKKVAQTSSVNDYVGPCYQCLAVLNDPGFCKVLLKEKPDPENIKYTPKM